MKEPCTMKCCKYLTEKTNRHAEQAFLKHEVTTKRKCLLCHKPAK